MRIIFLGTGPTQPVKEGNKIIRTNSSVLLDSILIDCTPQFLMQAEKNNITPDDIKAVLITHAHKDAIAGLKDLDNWLNKKINLYAPSRVDVNRFVKKFKNLNIVRISPHQTYEISGKKITPFRVIHFEYHPTLGDKFPTYGYRIDNLVYAEDMESIPANSIKYFKNADVIIADGAMWFDHQIRGHLSVDKTLLLAKRFEPKVLIIIQAGRTYPNQEKAEKEIESYWNEIKGDTKTKIVLAYDGMVFDTKKLELQFPGIYLPKPHAELIWSGEKKLIIKAKNYKNMINKPLYFMDKDYSYGILRLKKPKLISLKEFRQLADKHMITEEERKKWWGDNTKLYAYEFDILDKFEDPKPVEIPAGVQTFVSETKFLSDKLESFWIFGKKIYNDKLNQISEQELIENIQNYDPSKINNKQLADDWRIVNAWYATYKRTNGKGIKFSKETIINLAKLIYNEIIKRVKEGKMKHDFQPEKMKPSSLELYKIVSKPLLLADWRDLKFLDGLDDFTIIKDCISLIGSSVTQEHKPHDIDILIRIDKPNEFIKRAIEVRLSKMFPEDLQDKLHFVWGEEAGPHDSYIPLFDLQLKRIRPAKIITMIQDLSSKITLMKPFVPQKPLGSAYYDLNKFLEVLKS